MDLDRAVRGITAVRRTGGAPAISSVEYDSRRAGPGALWVAMRGSTIDGNRFLRQAVAQGVSVIVTDSSSGFEEARQSGVAAIQVSHGRRSLAAIAANFYEHPEACLKLSGVTGTNGKTTTAFLLESMLRRQGRGTILVGTIEYRVAGRVEPAPHTTPESSDLLALFREGVNAGVSEAVMEVSSHALDQERVSGLAFDVAIFTNLTRDHLDYHGTMEQYFAAKSKLFDGSSGSPPRVAIVHHDDPYSERLRQIASRAGVEEIVSYGVERGDFRAATLEMAPSGMRFRLISPQGTVPIESRLTGWVNVANLLAASAAAISRGLTLEQAAEGASSLVSVPGRFESIDCGQDFAVVVDYAHTDDALRNVLAVARRFVMPAGGRVITMFGCGGDRDRAKRPLMGQAAGEASDIVVLTSDNPRSEDPHAILAQVLPGLKGTRAAVRVEPDRAQAIRIALAEARPGDLVLLAGKGHEKTQAIGDHVIPFDDAAVAREILQSGNLQSGNL